MAKFSETDKYIPPTTKGDLNNSYSMLVELEKNINKLELKVDNILINQESFSFQKYIYEEKYFVYSKKMKELRENHLSLLFEIEKLMDIGIAREKKDIIKHYKIKTPSITPGFKEGWLDIVSKIDKKLSIDEASSMSLYIMAHFYRKDFLSLENNIKIVEISSIPRVAMVLILRYTRVAKKKISNWIEFRDRCSEELIRRGEDPRRILKDLLNEK